MWKNRIMLAGLVVLGAGCAPRGEELADVNWCSERACAIGHGGRKIRKGKREPEPSKPFSVKGGSLYPDSKPTQPLLPSAGVRPEVLLVSVERARGPNGELQVAVRRFGDVLDEVCKGGSEAICNEVLGEHREQFAVVDYNCTGTFVSKDTIITASHCLPCTNWPHTYVVMGFHRDREWPTVPVPNKPGLHLLQVPADNVLQLSHLKTCEWYDGSGQFCHKSDGCDVALVEVCPPQHEQRLPEFEPRKLVPKGAPSLVDLAVYSHAWGLPLKRYDVDVTSYSKLSAHFSNGAGGSGAALVNGDNQVIGIVRGNVPHSAIADCSKSRSDKCDGQRLTPYDDIARITNAAQCGQLQRHFKPHPNGCRECNPAAAPPQTGK
jgi:hypothetical protein